MVKNRFANLWKMALCMPEPSCAALQVRWTESPGDSAALFIRGLPSAANLFEKSCRKEKPCKSILVSEGGERVFPAREEEGINTETEMLPQVQYTRYLGCCQ